MVPLMSEMGKQSTAGRKCECSDPGCPACHGRCGAGKRTTVYRVDMADETGTWMCRACADDALASGPFYEKSHRRGDGLGTHTTTP